MPSESGEEKYRVVAQTSWINSAAAVQAAVGDQSPEVVDFKLGVADFAVGDEVFVAKQLVGTAQ